MSVSKILQSYLALTPDAVLVGCRPYDEDIVKVAYINDSFTRLFGYTPGEALGQPVRMLHAPDAWEDFVAEVQPRFERGEEHFFAETRCVRADGSVFWASISFFAVEVPEEQSRYTCATYRDICDLKMREANAARALEERERLLAEQDGMYQELLATQTRLLSAINAYPDPFVIYDKDKRLVTCNTAYQESMSTRPERITKGMHLTDVLHEALDSGLIPPAPGPRNDYIEELYSQHDAKRVEDIELPGDRHHRVLRSRASNGDWIIIRMDFTALARERRQSTEMHERMIAALNAYPDPFSIFDADERLLMWNDAFEALFGNVPGELRAGLAHQDILRVGVQNGRLSADYLAENERLIRESRMPVAARRAHCDVEFADGTNYRMMRSRAPKGDHVVIHQNTTELVRQRSSAENSQARLLAAISAYSAPFCIYDAQRRLVVWNRIYALSFTDDPDELFVGMPMHEVVDIGLRNGRFADAVGREVAWREEILQSSLDCVPVEDIELAGDTFYRMLRSPSSNGDIVTVWLDTTQLVRQRRALQETQDRLISALNAFPDPFAIYDQNMRLVVWNPAYTRNICGEEQDVYVGMHVADVLRIALERGRIPVAEGREEEWLDEYLEGAVGQSSTQELEFADDQHYRIIRSRSERDETLVLRLNVTETVRQRRALEQYAHRLEAANQEITYKALHDQLTGLGNRRYLSERFETFSRKRREDGGELAALHIDLDFFKQINDTIGHNAGDHVLTDVARRISDLIDPAHVLARIGGDEFVVLMWLAEECDAPEQLAQLLIEALSEPSVYEGRECRFGCSIGIAKTPLADEKELLTNSDVALYKAKRAGRGCAAVFDRHDIYEMRRTKELADDIVRGLDAREFVPFFQPQVDAITGEVVGVEALARWRHPTHGILAPDAFLDVAAEMNVIADIDRMIFNNALEKCATAFTSISVLPDLSFNVSAKRLEHRQINEIGQMVRKYPGNVAFELLETIYLEEESDFFLMCLDRLRELGIGVEVDDFGSGRASVVALQKIAPDRLKIDRRLVAPMREGNSAAQLVRSIIDIGHALDISVTAEGVETAEQVGLLARFGAERLQGYFIAPPLDLPDLLDFLANRRRTRAVV